MMPVRCPEDMGCDDASAVFTGVVYVVSFPSTEVTTVV